MEFIVGIWLLIFWGILYCVTSPSFTATDALGLWEIGTIVVGGYLTFAFIKMMVTDVRDHYDAKRREAAAIAHKLSLGIND